ncbi:SusC/RagA family TonB-linked outer membrane protein [Saccharicrinis aurantiacus]|uniref:SusC/RagA family TonB-linked outer membrane protein n=1 Tax=Saccharicrinis aurantiacus TaxID=1849719 RepID=UPI0024902792|nr:TonB-dependent receptor [Saccharicrinis aurantiacus]
MEERNRVFKSSRRWMLTLFIALLSMGAFAQQSIITGVVTSTEDGLPIPGVSVVVKGTSNGTITNIDGKFSVKVWQGKELVFSFVGMETQTIVAKGGVINVDMQPELFGLDEVVAIGYGTQTKKEISGAVVQVKSEDLTRIATADIGTALQGQVAGVNVQASSGEPGAASNIQIRGVSSIDGSNNPLYVVDGIPQDGNPNLSTNEIETMDILKDAASCAIYGTRGAAGVILITTKQGESGTLKINVDSYMGIQKITSGIELMGFEDYWYGQYIRNLQGNSNTTLDHMWTQLRNDPNQFTHNTQLIDVIQNDNALIQNHSVNISGGQENLRFSVVASYFDQEGILINSGYERFNLRSNINFSKKKWQFNMGLGMVVDEKQSPPFQLLYDAYKYKPFQQPLDPNDNSVANAGTGTDDGNMQQLGNLMYKFLQTDVKNGENFNGNFNIKYNIAKGFDFNSRFGAKYANSTRVVINPPIYIYNNDGDRIENPQNRSQIRNTADRSTSMTWENSLTYTKKIKDHKLRLLGVFSTEKHTYSQFTGSRMDLVSGDVYVLNGGTNDPNATSGFGRWGQDRESTLVGMLGRAQYDYKGRYLFSASVRRDGSSRFAKENRWGIFPSASAAWNVADEAFWTNVKKTVNAFKVRASLGTTGNQNFGDYINNANIETGYDYPSANGTLVTGLIQQFYANPDIKWETTQQVNFGIDMGMFKNRLSLNADIYQSNKRDMLFPRLMPLSAGSGQNQTITLNVGDMVNKGVELSLGWRNSGKIKWGVNGTFTKNLNEITRMAGDMNSYILFNDGWAVNNEQKISGIQQGYEAGAFFVMPTDGIVNTQEKLAEYQRIRPEAKMGDLIYVDTNGDGIIDDSDRVYGGSGMPDFELGLNANASYKGFDVSMQWYASIGNDIVNGSKIYAMQYETHADYIYQWSENNPYAGIPAQRGRQDMNVSSVADIWVEDGSFVRLRNVTLGYTIPAQKLKKAGISKLRIYIASDNPLTLTKYGGYDPEVGGNGLATRGLDKGNYPIASQYRIGLQLGF